MNEPAGGPAALSFSNHKKGTKKSLSMQRNLCGRLFRIGTIMVYLTFSINGIYLSVIYSADQCELHPWLQKIIVHKK